MTDEKEKNKNDYKVIISELGVNPFRVVNIVFALVCIIPLLAVFYVIVGKHFLYDIFIGVDGVHIVIAILVALTGLFYAYNLVRNLIQKLMIYAEARRQADCRREEFMMSVSRDLRAPLEVIKFEIGNILAGVNTTVGGIIGETVKRCMNATNKLADLIKDIMYFPNAGFIRTNVQRRLVDLRDIVKAELDSAQRLAKNNNLYLRSRFAAENANLWGDEKKLSRMAVDLISNAIKFTPQGGVVNVSVSSDNDTVRFAVGNKGPDSSSKNINGVSEKDKSSDSRRGREGLAGEISIAKDVAELHNGNLTISDILDKELEFKIVLPRDLRTRNGMTGLKRDIKNKVSGIEDENIGMWLNLNKVLTEIVSKTKTTK